LPLCCCHCRRQRRITDAGFQLLLRDSHHQLWVFLAQYINDTASAAAPQYTSPSKAKAKGNTGAGAGLPSLISFLMQLGFMRVGQPYALSSLAPTEAAIAGHMMQLGLLLPFEVGCAHARLAGGLDGEQGERRLGRVGDGAGALYSNLSQPAI
jgi:hypothetical protein